MNEHNGSSWSFCSAVNSLPNGLDTLCAGALRIGRGPTSYRRNPQMANTSTLGGRFALFLLMLLRKIMPQVRKGDYKFQIELDASGIKVPDNAQKNLPDE